MIAATGVTLWVAGACVSVQGRQEKTTFYEVSGTSAGELRESLNRSRPVGPDGQPHDALTLWHIRWQYRTAPSASACSVASFNVSLEVTMTLPKWSNESDGASAVVERWRSYTAALLVHENGHKALGEAAAAAIKRAGDAIPPQASCADLGRVIDETGTRVLDEYRQKERQYDAETGHGRTQGARFP